MTAIRPFVFLATLLASPLARADNAFSRMYLAFIQLAPPIFPIFLVLLIVVIVIAALKAKRDASSQDNEKPKITKYRNPWQR